MGELGALVEAWRDRRDPRPSDAWIGEKVGIKSRSSVKPWLAGESMPKAEHLRRLAAIIGVNYRTVLDAALLDAGYLTEMEHRGNPTPSTSAGSAPAAPPVTGRSRGLQEPQPEPSAPSIDETPRPTQP